MAYEHPVRRTCVRMVAHIVMVILAAGAVEAAGMISDVTNAPRVRSSDAYIRAMIDEATERSATFHRLIDRIEATNGILYVEPGTCGHRLHAYLSLTVTRAGAYRILRIQVDISQPDLEVMTSIGHELQHAIEVLSNPTLTSHDAVYLFYAREAPTNGNVFETTGAIRAGNAVRDELTSRARSVELAHGGH